MSPPPSQNFEVKAKATTLRAARNRQRNDDTLFATMTRYNATIYNATCSSFEI